MSAQFYLSIFTAVLLAGSSLADTLAEESSPLPSLPQEHFRNGLSVQGSTGLQTQKEGPSFPRRTLADTTDERIGIGGFVLDETFSVVGSNFYSVFFSTWTEPEEASLYTVYVREKPTPQFGSRMIVEVGDTVIFQTFLRPNARQTRKAAKRAVQRTRLYIREYYEPRDVY